MDYVRLGRTGILSSRLGIEVNSSEEVLLNSYNRGINIFYARAGNSEMLNTLGRSFIELRSEVNFAISSTARTKGEIEQELFRTLSLLETDYIDLYLFQSDEPFRNLSERTSIARTLEGLVKQKKIRSFGFSSRNFEVVREALNSGLFGAIHFPFNIASPERTEKLARECEKCDVGFLAGEPLFSGIIDNMPLAFGFFNQYESVVPLWEVESKQGLNELFYFNSHPPIIDENFKRDAERIRDFFN